MLPDMQLRDATALTRTPVSGQFLSAGAVTAHMEASSDEAEMELLLAKFRQALAWLVLLASALAGAAGAAGLGLVSRSASLGIRSSPALVTAFGQVSRLLPIALAI